MIVFTLTFMYMGCISQTRKGKVWQPVKPTKAPFVHLVRWPQEILPIIAKWYTGDNKNWESIANANPNINPGHLFVGNKIFIPEDLLKTRDPIPREFVNEYYVKLKKKKKSSKSVKNPKKTTPATEKTMSLPKQEDEFEIFGPK